MLARYETEIVEEYNRAVTFVIKYSNHPKVSADNKAELVSFAKYVRDRFVLCLQNLKKSYVFPNDLSHDVDQSLITPLQGDVNYNNTENFPEDETNTDNIVLVNDSESSESEEMVSKEDFYNLATKAIKTYSGDPLKRTAFINSIRLMTMAGDAHKALLVSIILTKLEGNAEDAVPTNVKTVDEIVAALKQSIKAESSKVLAARLMGMRFDRNKIQEFSKEVEELAENLKKSLVTEGMTPTKASEVVIDETVKMCRSNSKSDLVKAVLSATRYEDHKEVVAKLVLESSTEVQEKKVLAYTAQQNSRRGRGRKFRGNFKIDFSITDDAEGRKTKIFVNS